MIHDAERESLHCGTKKNFHIRMAPENMPHLTPDHRLNGTVASGQGRCMTDHSRESTICTSISWSHANPNAHGYGY